MFPTTITGKDWEEDCLGHASVEWRGGYVPYRHAMAVARRHQPWSDPSDPDPRFANDLHASVADLLELEDYTDLRFYTAVGTALDFFHGIDAWFEFQGQVVTIDVTVDSGKLVHKANLVLNVLDQEQALAYGSETIARMFREGGR